MNYKKIKPKKIYEEVAEAIYEMIRSGHLKPGDKLDSVQQLAENFQVGRSAIREALTSLRAMGLVEMKQGEGTYVKEFEKDQITFPLSTAILMNKNDISELVEVRKIVESGTAAAAAKKRTEQHLSMMEAALEAMLEAKGDGELGETADLQFHMALAEAAQNQLLLNLMNHVSELMVETMRETRKVWLFSKETTIEQLYKEHLAIYEAIKAQDEEAARNNLLIHLENVDSILGKYFHHTTKYNGE
ncbi:FadR/GntR family transcriptional regulator [Neobacillus kokaensis]|uniref:HTH-type transcriptional regulator LutR n=1 Tax=Neobacillus kokaensis TaxID=2759023 RepID=A0ABQ3NB72_9BACI|nr:FadR/GntR family transcriptional regulator [Neobacillus kokaensis]GHI01153.1 HTH-type transcriptional regulator LutR [Neobacillus kokaensis]